MLRDEWLQECTGLPHQGSGQEAVWHRHQQLAKEAGKVSQSVPCVAILLDQCWKEVLNFFLKCLQLLQGRPGQGETHVLQNVFCSQIWEMNSKFYQITTFYSVTQHKGAVWEQMYIKSWARLFIYLFIICKYVLQKFLLALLFFSVSKPVGLKE